MSELLFPATTGGFRSRSFLDTPFEHVGKALALPFRFTPRGMRRTYHDLARAAGIHDVVTRAISGHLTETMQHHYSTARGAEIRDALALVAGLAIGPAPIEAPIIDIETARAKRQLQVTRRSAAMKRLGLRRPRRARVAVCSPRGTPHEALRLRLARVAEQPRRHGRVR